jgi:hypothetical protein
MDAGDFALFGIVPGIWIIVLFRDFMSLEPVYFQLVVFLGQV